MMVRKKEKTDKEARCARIFSMTMVVAITLSVFVGIVPAENVNASEMPQNETYTESEVKESFTANATPNNESSQSVNVSEFFQDEVVTTEAESISGSIFESIFVPEPKTAVAPIHILGADHDFKHIWDWLDTGDVEIWKWGSGGAATWFGDLSTYYYDGDSARSGDIGDSQHSYLKAHVIGPGTITFYWKVSSETNDSLKFYVDGEEKASISGEMDWHQRSYVIGSGNHTLTWQYEKDDWISAGSDCGWVDKVEYAKHFSVGSQLGINMLAMPPDFTEAHPVVYFDAQIEFDRLFDIPLFVASGEINGNPVNTVSCGGPNDEYGNILRAGHYPPGTYHFTVGLDVLGYTGTQPAKVQLHIVEKWYENGTAVTVPWTNIVNIELNLPSSVTEYQQHNYIEFSDNITSTNDPYMIAAWNMAYANLTSIVDDMAEEAQTSPDVAMCLRHPKEGLTIIQHLATAGEAVGSEGAIKVKKVAKPAGHILGFIQAAAKVRATGGDVYDFIRRYGSDLFMGFVWPVPFQEELCGWAVTTVNIDDGVVAKGQFFGIDTVTSGYLAAGIHAPEHGGYTPDNLPANFHRKWPVGPYGTIAGNIKHFQINIDAIDLGPGDTFAVLKQDGSVVTKWEGPCYEKNKSAVCPCDYCYIEIITDDSGADCPGFKFSSEAPIKVKCHQAWYYSGTNTNPDNLVKFGTEAVPIDFDWGSGSPYPEVPADNFVAKYIANLEITASDTYTFYLTGENGGVVMYIFNETGKHKCEYNLTGLQEHSFSIHLTEGEHPFEIIYTHTTGDASFKLSWSNSTFSKQVIPEEYISTKFTKAVEPHDPIHINGNSQFTAANGVAKGSGTESDPYIIQCWDIDASTAPLWYGGITIENTDAYFVIRKCAVHDGMGCICAGGCPGIHLDNVANGKIEFATFINNKDGIFLDSSMHNEIKDCRFLENQRSGIFLSKSPYNAISGNVFTESGISFDDWDQNPEVDFVESIDDTNLLNDKPVYYFCDKSNEVIDGSDVGQLILVKCSNFVIKNIEISSAGEGVQILASHNNMITNCTVHHNIGKGIELYHSSDTKIESCQIYESRCCVGGIMPWYQPSGHGIQLFSSINTQITNSKIYNNLNYGIGSYESDNLLIKNCEIYNNSDASIYSDGVNTMIENCIIRDSKEGIELSYGSKDSNITNCTICNNSVGIYVEETLNTKIRHCNISGNTEYGIRSWTDSPEDVDANCNWWGDGSGPYNPVTNPDGTGDNVSDYVICNAWYITPDNGMPVASFTYTPAHPKSLVPITFNASESYDCDGGIITSYSWDFDASDGIQEDATGIEVTHNYTTGGTYIVTLTVIDDESTAGNVSKSITIATVEEAVDDDNPFLTWTTGGDAEWFAQIENYHYDHDAAQSGDIGDGQSSYVQANYNGWGVISFYWKVNSEAGHDYLRFYVNGEEKNKISGSTDWRGESYQLDGGDYTFKWVYTKDGNLSSGSDCGWLDQVVIHSALDRLLDDFNDGVGDGWRIYDQGGVTEDNQLWIMSDIAPLGAARYGGTIGTFNPQGPIYWVDMYVDVTPIGTGQIDISIVDAADGIYGFYNSPGFYFTVDVDHDRVFFSIIDEDGFYYYAFASSTYEWGAGETHTVMLHVQTVWECEDYDLMKGEIDGEEVLSAYIPPLHEIFHHPFNMTVYLGVCHACASFDNVIVGGIDIRITPPACSMLINDGTEYTTSREVTLTLSAEDPESGVAEMRFANDHTWDECWSPREPYNTTKVWNLSEGYGEKKVYVKYKNDAGLEPICQPAMQLLNRDRKSLLQWRGRADFEGCDIIRVIAK